MHDTETLIKIERWRAKAIAGTLSIEDQIEAVKVLMAGRRSASAASEGAAKTRAKAKGPTISGDDLLDEMMAS